MVEVAQHLLGCRPYVDLLRGDAHCPHQAPGVGLGRLAGGESRHRDADDVAAGASQPIHGLGGHDQCVGGVDATGDADHHVGAAGHGHAAHQPVDLDVERLVAVLVQPLAVAGDEGEAGDIPSQVGASGLALRRGQLRGTELRGALLRGGQP